MSVVKVNLMSELDALALMPFKRLFLQRKNDNYLQATSDYTAKLRKLYKSNLERQHKLDDRTKRTEKYQTDSAIFRLDCNAAGSETLKRLDGITIERSSLPNADVGDRVVLIKLDGATDEGQSSEASSSSSSTQVVVGRGQIQSVTSSEIRIKLLEPLILEPESATDNSLLLKDEQKQEETPKQDATDTEGKTDTLPEGTLIDTNGITSTETKAPEAANHVDGSQGDPNAANDEQTKKSDSDRGQGGPSASRPAGDRPIIDFKIKFDTSAQTQTGPAAVAPAIRGHQHQLSDQYSELVERVLDRFSKFKCDPAIHKNLLGFYDERSDLVHDKARVMTFSGLRVKLRGQQRVAIEQSIKRRMSLIEGPAGSGKTLVAAYIAGNMSRLKRSKVLVCSPIQTTVDKLAQLIDQIDGVQVVKLPGDCQIKLRRASGTSKASGNGAGSLSGASSYIESSDIQSSHCHLDKLVNDEIYLQAWNRSKDTLRNHHDSLRSHAYRMVTSCSQQRRRELEARILSRADVVCCTNQQAGSYLLDGVEFSVLILDDVQATSEIDCLVPMMARGVRQVTLLSDTRRRVRLARSMRKPGQTGQMSNGTRPSTAHKANSHSSPPASLENQPNGRDKFQDNNEKSNVSNSNSLRKTKTATSQIGRGQSNQSTLTRKKRHGKAARVSAISQVSVKTVDSLRPTTSANPSFTSTNEPSLVPGGLFERLLSIGLPTVDFRIQFRMHETLSNFTNHHFYLGRLKDDPDTNEKLKLEIDSSLLIDEKRFDWLPNRKYLTAMFQVGKPATSSSQSHDQSVNNCELTALKPMIDKLDELISKLVHSENIQESRIGVIFNRKLSKDANSLLDLSSQIKKGTIGDFIGQERDFMILVTLPGQAVLDSDSNDAHQDRLVHLSTCSEIPCDFKHDDGALNCALTRARLGMFIITDIITDDDPGQGTNFNNSATGQGEPQISPIESPVCRGWADVVNYYVESELSVQC